MGRFASNSHSRQTFWPRRPSFQLLKKAYVAKTFHLSDCLLREMLLNLPISKIPSSHHLMPTSSNQFNIQHRQVCSFPSVHFYNGSLRSAAVTRTEYLEFCSQFPNFEPFWPSRDRPTVFYSVQGRESHPSSTEKVRLQSRCNHQEAGKIVSCTHARLKIFSGI